MKRFINFLMAGFFGLVLASCGSDGGGGAGTGTGSITMKATAQTNKQVIASLQKPTATQRMWAFLSGKEAIAAHAGCDSSKKFALSGGGSVCLETAYVVFDEVELERENPSTGVEDEAEFGPFVVDLLGVPNDGILGDVPITVPAGEPFKEVKFKVDDLDDKNNDNKLDDPNKDDIPKNILPANAVTAGLVKRSLHITGSATGGGTTHKAFDFFTDIEAKIKVPLTQSIFSGDNIITFFDLSTGFGKLDFTTDITATMDGTMGNKKCGDPTLSKPQQLACDIVKNIDLFDDVDNDNVGEAGEDRGDDHSGGGGADDTQPHD